MGVGTGEMKTVFIEPAHGQVVIALRFTHPVIMLATYQLKAYSDGSSTIRLLKAGSNADDHDEMIVVPADLLGTGILDFLLSVALEGKQYEAYPHYDLVMEVYQQGKMVGFTHEQGVLDGSRMQMELSLRLVCGAAEQRA